MALKKVVIAAELVRALSGERSLLNRADIQVFTAFSNDDVLRHHGEKRADLIISTLHASGMKSEDLYAKIRNDRALQSVSVILVCPDTPGDMGRSAACHANVVMTLPLDRALLLKNIQRLLNISSRESYRVLLNVQVEGDSNSRPFFCRSENLSTTGILIETDKTLAKGDRVKCSFFLPGSHQIFVNGEITRVVRRENSENHFQYGIQFSQLAGEAASAIKTFLEMKSKAGISGK